MKQEKKEILNISIKKELKEELSEIAEKRKMNRSAMVAGMIEKNLNYDVAAETMILVELMNILSKAEMNPDVKKKAQKSLKQLIKTRR